ITTLKEQLSQEIRKRQTFLNRSITSGEEITALRSMVNDSLSFVSRDPKGLDPVLLDYETKRLADSSGYLNEPPQRHRSPTRRTLSPSISVRAMRSGATSAGGLSISSPSGSKQTRSSRTRLT
ncbi:unnamed protein product, partial [Didymodactylos carnosus]